MVQLTLFWRFVVSLNQGFVYPKSGWKYFSTLSSHFQSEISASTHKIIASCAQQVIEKSSLEQEFEISHRISTSAESV
jgi:hypothetical protein